VASYAVTYFVTNSGDLDTSASLLVDQINLIDNTKTLHVVGLFEHGMSWRGVVIYDQ